MYTLKLNSADLVYGAVHENGNTYVIPPVGRPEKFSGDSFLWIINADSMTFSLITTNGAYKSANKNCIEFENEFTRKDFSGLPYCDFYGNKFEFNLSDNSAFQNTLSHFYWENILNECAERTVMRRKKRLREGYVLSTLKIDFYGGTYPAVDHEFHIRGRLAMGDEFDAEIVRRMIELQLRVMKTDWRKQYRNLLSLQPNGRREYRVYRRSKDKKTKAVMFLVTANLEIVEEIYNYYCLTKDKKFLTKTKETVEKGLGYVQSFIDENGALWGDVYYEDQVMKDGRNAQAQAFAIHIFKTAARLEFLLGDENKMKEYIKTATRMAENYVKPVPSGYWDEKSERYVDWIDRRGIVHDHVHLLANALSVTYGLNDEKRNKKVNETIFKHDNIFQKYPSFVAARIEDYTDSEIGTGGPYDLCAAGRYWCHDAKYRKFLGNGELLKKQLLSVCRQAEIDDYKPGERYDMNYIYYNTGEDGKKNWHGSPLYYEYPNVFADVLVHDYIGLDGDEEADVKICPCLADFGSVTMESYGIKYEYSEDGFKITNLREETRRIKVDLSKLNGNFIQSGEIIEVKGKESVLFEATR